MWRMLKRFFIPDAYVSEIDQFLQHFDRCSPDLSDTQRHEHEKYLRIFKQRDTEL